MKCIYENRVTARGSCVEEFKDAGIFVISGDNAPKELADYCYSVHINPAHGRIAPDQILKIDDESWRITAVGHTVSDTLKSSDTALLT